MLQAQKGKEKEYLIQWDKSHAKPAYALCPFCDIYCVQFCVSVFFKGFLLIK